MGSRFVRSEPADLPELVFRGAPRGAARTPGAIWFAVEEDPRVVERYPYIPKLREDLLARAFEERRTLYLLKVDLVSYYVETNWLDEPVGEERVIRDYLVAGTTEPLDGWEVYETIRFDGDRAWSRFLDRYERIHEHRG